MREGPEKWVGGSRAVDEISVPCRATFRSDLRDIDLAM
jgi:hypothetical protein